MYLLVKTAFTTVARIATIADLLISRKCDVYDVQAGKLPNAIFIAEGKGAGRPATCEGSQEILSHVVGPRNDILEVEG